MNKTIINTNVPEFSVPAFVNGEFKTITKEDTLGHWSIFFFYPADFTFVCPTELLDMADNYAKFTQLIFSIIQMFSVIKRNTYFFFRK